MRDPVKDLANEIDDPFLLLCVWADAHDDAGLPQRARGLRLLAELRRWPGRSHGREGAWFWNVGNTTWVPGRKMPHNCHPYTLPVFPGFHWSDEDALKVVPRGHHATASAALLVAADYFGRRAP